MRGDVASLQTAPAAPARGNDMRISQGEARQQQSGEGSSDAAVVPEAPDPSAEVSERSGALRLSLPSSREMGSSAATSGGDPETRERIRRFISDTFFVDEFADDESFLRSGIIDSLGMMNLVAFLQHDLSLTVEDSELVPENLDSVSNVVSFVARKRRGGEGV